MGYAIVKIKKGAKCFQDRITYNWPPSDYDELLQYYVGVEDDCLFVAKKKVKNNKAYWYCQAEGAGMENVYGNGSIFASDVEMITPLLGYKPELSDYV